jgi:polyhydroxybutyrate depolymerase
MTRRPLIVGVMLVCTALPALFVVVNAATFYATNRTTGTIRTFAGDTREYILHVPASYDSAKPTPLVISLHGAENWPSFQMSISRWNPLADEQGFIVVYPAGVGAGPKVWTNRRANLRSRMPDVVFISELLDRIEASYNIDRARIYANGLSNGGGMSYVLSCTLSDRIAAFGPVSSAVTLPIDWCDGAPPAPVVAFHGTADPFVPYEGAKMGYAPVPFPSIQDWIAAWARRNRCAPAPVDSDVRPDVTRREYTECADDASVVLYTVKGGGHQWYGGTKISEWLVGPYKNSIDATRVMWEFFKQHPLLKSRSRA